MSEERKMILEMLKNGELTVADAERLLDAVGETDDSTEISTSTRRHKGAKPKRLVIQAYENGKRVINLRIPFSLVGIGIKLGAKFSAGKTMTVDGVETSIMEGIDLEEILSELDYGEITLPYTLVDVDDENDKVLIVLE
ncbi:MAG: hypothetical protein LBN00_02075 [Oscillospiraceae bacterium]|jgi:hypothetical protein|nr:hypothetical protein [Oscillospiraceae bacterium]